MLTHGPGIPENGWKCSTILVDGDFAGHITQVYSSPPTQVVMVTLGWNIVPELWGHGIVPNAVSQLLEDRFTELEAIEFQAFCFNSNTRCVRVLQKLGFEKQEPRWMEHARNFVQTFGRHRLLKYGLTYNNWLKLSGGNGG